MSFRKFLMVFFVLWIGLAHLSLAAEDLLMALRAACPALAVIVLSGQPEAEGSALAAGADAFVSKADPPEQVLAAIRSTG